MALFGVIGSIIKGDRERKAANRAENTIRDTLASALELRAAELTSIKENQSQVTARNINVQASSGFEASSFAPLAQYEARQQQKQIDLYNKETELIRKQTLAGIPQAPSKTLQTLATINQGVQGVQSAISLFAMMG